MAQIVDKVFTANGNWTAPAEVFNVKVIGVQAWIPISSYGSSCAMNSTDGLTYAWGLNVNGELGVGSVTAASSPTAVLNSYQNDFVQLVPVSNDSLTDQCALAINSSGDLFAWGTNFSGQLGVGDVTVRSSPVLVLGGFKWASVLNTSEGVIGSGAASFTLGLSKTGSTYAWGGNANGQLGVGDVTPRSSPVAVLGGLIFSQLCTSISPIGGSAVSYGLTSAGQLYAWGANAQGQLGVGDVVARSSPVAVLGGLTFSQISSGCDPFGTISFNYSYGLTSTGSLYAWGSNINGQLGVGDVTVRSSPVAVLGSLTFSTVLTSGNSTVALSTSGHAYAWGLNNVGQLGLGDLNPRSSPVAVLGGLTFTQIFNIGYSFFGLTSSGQLYAWGANSVGALGVGDTVGRSSPVAVLGSLSFSQVFTGAAVYGLTTSGQIYAWGFNPNGQLGVGDVVARSSPVLVLGGHYVASQSPQIIKEIQVVPGTTYALNLQNPIAFFGTIPLGPMLNQITLQYQQ